MTRSSVSFLQIIAHFLPEYSRDIGTKQPPYKYPQMDSVITELKRERK